MTTKQFQAEPEIDHFERTQPVRMPRFRTSSRTVSHGALAQLLLDLRVNGALSEQNERLLDTLAIDGARIFLSGDNEIRYPLNAIPYAIELSQPDIISAESLVTRKFNGKDENQTIVAHSARISPGAAQPITLGIYGSERLLNDTTTISSFGEVARDCRSIYSAVNRLAEQIEPALKSDSAVLILNRASGRVIAANNAAVSLLSKTTDELIGAEYGQLKEKIQPLLTRSRIEMTNVTQSDIYLTVMKLRPVIARSINLFPGEFLIDQMRKKLSFVTTAVSDIDIENRDDDKPQMVTPEIFSELNQLNSLLSKLDLYICYNRHQQETVDLATELSRICDTITIGENQIIRIGRTIEGIAGRFPDSAFEFLCEAILAGHSHQSRVNSNTTISMNDDDASDNVKVRFETEYDQNADQHSYENFWRSYVGGISAKMGIELIHNGDAVGNSTLTEIRIKINA